MGSMLFSELLKKMKKILMKYELYLNSNELGVFLLSKIYISKQRKQRSKASREQLTLVGLCITKLGYELICDLE